MLILLRKEGPFIYEYKNDEFINFSDYDMYKHLGLVYPYMCIFKDNLQNTTPSILMLSYDTKMRLQYRYNDAHIHQSQQDKIVYVKLMINNLEHAMKQISADLESKDELKKLLSLMAYITMKTGIRIGKDINLRTYESIGLSTLMCRNVKCDKNVCVFDFIGKKGVKYTYKLDDDICVKLIRYLVSKCKNDNDFIFKTSSRKITYTDFNDYVKTIFKSDIVSGKDFRTLLANISFLDHFKMLELKSISADSKNTGSREKNIKLSIKHVASVLQNTNAVSKKSYIFSTILEYIYSNYREIIETNDIIKLLKKIFSR